MVSAQEKVKKIPLRSSFVLVIVFLISLTAPSHAFADLNSGLVGYWTINGIDTVWTSATAGTTNDLSGNGNTGTLTNMSRSTSPVAGKIGQALNFSGSNYIDVGASHFNFLKTTPFSGSVWIKTTTNNTIISDIDIVGTGGWLFSSQTGYISLGFFDSTFANSFKATALTTTVTDNKWHMVTFTYDGSGANTGINLYVDGAPESRSLATTGDGNPGTLVDSGFLFGASKLASSPFPSLIGSIDDTRVYNRALLATEVAQLYKQGQVTHSASPTQALTNGLVGYWTFDGKNTHWDTNKTDDLSGQGNTGTMTFMSTTTSPVMGKIGQGLKFDGSTNYIDVGAGHFNFLKTTPFSGSAWIKTSTTDKIIIGDFNAGISAGWFFETTSGKLLLDFANSQLSNAFSATAQTTTVTDNKWHLATFTYDGSGTNAGINLYVDGTLESMTTGTAGSGDPGALVDSKLLIGAEQFVGSPNLRFVGTMDDVRIYNRALSAAEVAQLYRQGAAKLATSPTLPKSSLNSGLVGYWTFDGNDTSWSSGTAGTTNDLSGQGNTGTLTSMSQSTTPVAGKIGQALTFDGANTFIDLGSPASFNITGGQSVFAWVKLNSIAGSQEIIGQASNLAAGGQFEIRVAASTGIISVYKATQLMLSSNAALAANKWYHIGFTRTGSSGSYDYAIYINGVSDNTAHDSLTSGLQKKTSIGRQGDNTDLYTNGVIDDVRIYNRALSAAEVAQLYKQGQASASH